MIIQEWGEIDGMGTPEDTIRDGSLCLRYSLSEVTIKVKSKFGGDTFQCIQRSQSPFHSIWARLFYIVVSGLLVHCTTNLFIPSLGWYPFNLPGSSGAIVS